MNRNKNNNGEKEAMTDATETPHRKLRKFRDVTTGVHFKRGQNQPRTENAISESDYSVLQTDSQSDLNYFVLGLPSNLGYYDKVVRLNRFSDKVCEIEDSATLMAIWAPVSTAE